MKHYPAREVNTPDKPKECIALCGYQSIYGYDFPDKKRREFIRPQEPHKTTCEGCRDAMREAGGEVD